MDGRFPFDSSNHHGNQNPLHNAQVRAALGLNPVDEALYLQRQQELRDYQIRQMLLQEQLDQQTRLDSILHEQQLKAIGEHLQEFPDLQQHYHSLLLNEQLQRHEEQNIMREQQAQMQHEELRRRQFGLLGHGGSQHGPLPSQHHLSQQSREAAARLREIAADSLAGNAVKRSEFEKRMYAKSDDESEENPKRKAKPDAAGREASLLQRNFEEEMMREQMIAEEMERQAEIEAIRRAMGMNQASGSEPMGIEMDMEREMKMKSMEMKDMETESPMKPSAQDLLDFATSTEDPEEISVSDQSTESEEFRPKSLGTVDDLLDAAEAEAKNDIAAITLLGIKQDVEWSDSDGEDDEFERDFRIAVKKEGETINLPGFVSALPQLPVEPEIVEIEPTKSSDGGHGVPNEDMLGLRNEKKGVQDHDSDLTDLAVMEYPFPIDTWWPSATSIRKERKSMGELPEDGDLEEDPQSILKGSPFRVDSKRLTDRLTNSTEPGVLEKIPHCKVHRMLMRNRKNPSAPELVYCWQVTELYPNDVMVCCSMCGTWRHAACGGHHKPYSTRDCIDEPFTAVCDRCFYEDQILNDFPLARKRIDKQRFEHMRRALATSAVMRQAAFAKHSGAYKWPLGSVSDAHIGGHTRSVHTRHDKAERQWTEMAIRLGRGSGGKLKEKSKVRTKELERLLMSVEDAEGHVDRHNMMLFLLRDSQRTYPVGFENRRRNLFDPAEDSMLLQDVNPPPLGISTSFSDGDDTDVDVNNENGNNNNGALSPIAAGNQNTGRMPPSSRKTAISSTRCAREGCTRNPRFDSLFCSDPCGLSAMEHDLLRTFQYASDIHPSFLRN